jgi:hypothetical protein
MQNPRFSATPTEESKPEWSPQRGWLGYVGGQFVGAGSNRLPTPGPEVESPQIVEMQVPSLGLVRIRYEASKHRHRKSVLWSWEATWCDKVREPADPPAAPL